MIFTINLFNGYNLLIDIDKYINEKKFLNTKCSFTFDDFFYELIQQINKVYKKDFI